MNPNVSFIVLLVMATTLIASEATYLNEVIGRKLQYLKPAYMAAYHTATLQKLTPNYNDALFQLHEELFPGDGYEKDIFLGIFARHLDACLLLVRNNQILAFVLTNPRFEPRYEGKRTGYVYLLGVHESHRGAGIARALLNVMRRVLKEDFGCEYITLHTDDTDSNAAALNLYRSSGYLAAEKIPNYFSLGDKPAVVDAVFMVRPTVKDWAELNYKDLPQLTNASTSEPKYPCCCSLL